MSAAEEADIPWIIRWTAQSAGANMVEFQTATSLAASTVRGDVDAAPAIAGPHFRAHPSWNTPAGILSANTFQFGGG